MTGSKRDSLGRQRGAVCLVALLFCAAVAPAATWQLSRGPSAVNFTVRHLIFSEVAGRFTRFAGSVDCPGDDLERARVEATIDVASIYTGHEDRDRHLVGDEFLAASKFPRMRFASRSVTRTGPHAYEIVGDLTIRGITREIVLAAKSMGRRETTLGERLDFEATGSLRRSDYDLGWNTLWDSRALIGEEVEISLKVALVPGDQRRR